MYIKQREHQIKLDDFNQPMGLELDPENRWIKLAELIPWDVIEDKYAKLFPSNTGMPAKPLRTALGSVLIQRKTSLVDVELVQTIMENPYMQFFIGLPGYTNKQPFAPSLMVEFRKRLTSEIVDEINELIIEYNTPIEDNEPESSDEESSDDPSVSGKQLEEKKPESDNKGTLILDATCAPQYIRFPQDISLLNEGRENLEGMIDEISKEHGLKKPRTYRKNARKDYLNIAKCKRRGGKKLRKAIKKQLQYVRRDIAYIDEFLAKGYELRPKRLTRFETIKAMYEQQLYMYENKVHSVPDRIVSLSQPHIRPIVRGKAKTPTEFGAKLDLSVDEQGMARIEKISFDAYNESEVLPQAVERYKERTGHYPERVLVDQIYRNRNNINFCKERGIRISGPALGRRGKDYKIKKKTEYVDNTDRIEVERDFSLAKRRYGLGKITCKLPVTTEGAISLAILTMNLDRLVAIFLSKIGFIHFWDFIRSKIRFNFFKIGHCHFSWTC